ncbi:MAG: DUF167 domain-containing protein [Candidatus Eisenbacteria bacterium]|uniref:UPF0235 protein HZA61_15855 n=1 Tax=Eiseniibacteriota bacterium TaxID=2212470 RepID=A0A933SJG0_UNCEI|nr:DUF167 domain-containing protein [Candidatus Eisenbacteria bacterium]
MNVRLAVRVQPGARRDALVDRLANGDWKLAVSAPPEDGRANDAVVELLAELLGVKRRQVVVTRGASSRSKTIEVSDLDAVVAEQRLAAALERAKGEHGE